MSDILNTRWFWWIVILGLLVVTLPLLIVWLILSLPAELKLFATVIVFVVWGLVSGYKDWLISKREKEVKSG
jgi:hypothetical protein